MCGVYNGSGRRHSLIRVESEVVPKHHTRLNQTLNPGSLKIHKSLNIIKTIVQYRRNSIMTKKYSRIAIIGGGPVGLAFAKVLGVEKFPQIDVFEKKNQVGGLWNYDGSTTTRPSVPSVNHTDPEFDNDEKSPMYKYLETNITKEIMQYKGVPFPEKCETFPTRQEVLEYVQEYGKTIPDDVKVLLNSEVFSVEKIEDVWKVEVSIDGSDKVIREYDAVVLANGHYNQPYIPDVEGLKQWNKLEAGSITHAKYFNESVDYKDKTVLIIGNSASGLDIALQISTVAKKVYNSVRTPSPVAEVQIHSVEEIGEIVKYDYLQDKSVTTKDGDTYAGIDVVIFCTGYLYTFPFLKSYLTGDDAIISNGERVRRLYKHLFYIPDPSLVAAGLPKSVIVMPFSECQAAFVARVFSGRLHLPDEKKQRADELKDIEARGEGKEFHNFKPPLDTEYCQDLQRIIDSHGLNEGFEAERWEDYRVGLRKESGPAKAQRYQQIVEHANRLRQNNQPYRLLRG